MPLALSAYNWQILVHSGHIKSKPFGLVHQTGRTKTEAFAILLFLLLQTPRHPASVPADQVGYEGAPCSFFVNHCCSLFYLIDLCTLGVELKGLGLVDYIWKPHQTYRLQVLSLMNFTTRVFHMYFCFSRHINKDSVIFVDGRFPGLSMMVKNGCRVAHLTYTTVYQWKSK